MTDLTTLRDLEKRLEEATGSSRDLDDAVFGACGLKVYPYDEPSGTTWGAAYPVTKSLDAAIALVERVLPHHDLGLDKTITDEGVQWCCSVWVSTDAKRDFGAFLVHQGVSKYPALALCLALIRTLIARGEP